MITTIVFDLGNVLVSFRPEEYLANNGYEKADRDMIINDIFKSPEWLAIDKGDITTTAAIEKISEKSSLSRAEITAVFNLRTKIIFPLTSNTNLLPELRKRGFKLYYLSNFPDDIFDEVRNRYSFFKYFNGGIISARVNASKPDIKIFEILLENYSLSAGECLFIDDSDINVKAAESAGMNGIHLERPEELAGQIGLTLGLNIKV